MLLPLEVLRNLGQDPIFNFGRDEVELNAKSMMILTEGSRKRFRAGHRDAKSGPVR
jgi:hypothetical protein